MMTKEADPWPEPDRVPDVLKQIVARALRKDASERYGSAGQMNLALLMARRELAARPARGVATREVPAFPPPAAPPPRSPVTAAPRPAPISISESTAPLARPKKTAPLKVVGPGRRGPLLLFLAAALLLLAGGVALLSGRGCARLAPAPAGAPGAR